MLPTPPVIAVPPTTTAAIEGNRSSAAKVGEPPARRPAIAECASSVQSNPNCLIHSASAVSFDQLLLTRPQPTAPVDDLAGRGLGTRRPVSDDFWRRADAAFDSANSFTAAFAIARSSALLLPLLSWPRLPPAHAPSPALAQVPASARSATSPKKHVILKSDDLDDDRPAFSFANISCDHAMKMLSRQLWRGREIVAATVSRRWRRFPI
jgi:hypothetical protein